MSDEGPRPLLGIEFKHACCSRHGEPFRKKWPAGYPSFAAFGLELVLAQAEFCRESWGDLARVPALLEEKPICCRLRPMQVLDLYLQANGVSKAWVRIRRCHACGGSAIGCAIAFLEDSGWIDREVCLACIAGVTGKLGTRG